MPINEYDDMMANDQKFEASGNEYFDLANQDKVLQKERLQQSMFVATKTEPDRQAQVLKLADEMKLPAPIVERNYDDLVKRKAPPISDYDKLINSSPHLAKWLEDPNNAALSQDDIPRLQGLEHTIKEHGFLEDMYNSLGVGFAQMNANLTRIPALMYDTAAMPQNYLMDAIGKPEWKVKSPEWSRENAVTKYYEGSAKALSQETPGLSNDIIDEAYSGNYAKAGRAFATQLVANAPNQMAILLAAYTGNPQAGLAFAGATTAAQKNDENLKKGMDPTVAVSNALASGAIEMGFEEVGTLGILKHWEHELASKVGKAGAAEIIKAAGKTLAYSVLAEGTEETLTSFANDFLDYSQGVNPDALQGSVHRALNAGIIGAGSGGAMTGPVGFGSVVHGEFQRKESARQGAMNRDVFLAISGELAESKTLARMPEAAQAFIAQATKDGPMENVFMPVEAVEEYLQSQNLSAAEFFQSIGQSQAYNEGKDTGLIKIPTAVFATKIAQSEHVKGFADNITFDPEKPTFKQAEAERQRVSEQLKAEADKALETTDKPVEDSTTQIERELAQQLFLAGRPQVEADAHAKLWSSFYKATADAEGVDPREIQARFPMTVNGIEQTPPAGEAVAQAAPDLSSLPERVVRNEQGERVFDPDIIAHMKSAINDSQLIPSGPKLNVVGDKVGNYGGASTFPSFFKDKGYKKADVLKIISKIEQGEKLTDKQRAVFEDLYDGAYDATTRGEFFQSGHTPVNGWFDEAGKPEAVVAVEVPEAEAAAARRSSVDLAAIEGTNKFGGTEVVNSATSFEVSFPSNLLQMINGANSLSNRLALSNLDKLMANAVYDGQEEVRKPSRNLKAIHRFYSLMSAGGEDFIVKMKVKESNQGKVLSSIEIERLAGKLGRQGTEVPGYTADGKASTVPIGLFGAALNNIRNSRQLFQGEAKQSPPKMLGSAGSQEQLKALVEKYFYSSNISFVASDDGSFAVHNAKGKIEGFRVVEKKGRWRFEMEPGSLLQSAQGGARGSLQIKNDGTFNLNIFAGADASTAIHEFMHYALEVTSRMAKDENASEFHREQMQSFKTFWKENAAHILDVVKDEAKREKDTAKRVKLDLMVRDIEGRGGAEYIANQADMFGETTDETDKFVQVQLHEYAARAFETYARSGKAPTEGLKKAFRKFKRWLMQIYKSATQLRVQVTPDIRRTFDRMLATQEEIDQAQGRVRAEPLFSGDLSVHMSDEQAKSYRETIDAVKAEAEERLSAEVEAENQRMKTAEMKKARAEIKEQVTKQVDNDLVYKALSILTKGKMPDGTKVEAIKIDRAALVSEYGEEILDRMPERTHARKGGVSPDVAAEVLGFETGEALVQELTKAVPREDLIEQLTDAEMRDKHPTLLDNGKLPDAAMKVIHSESRAKLLMMEMKLLLNDHTGKFKDIVKRIARRMPTDKVVREQAEKIIGGRKVSELRPAVFMAAEKRAAAEAGKHLANGDIEAAFDAKRRELLNHELYRAAVEAKETTEKAEKLFKKFRGKDEDLAKTRDMDLVNAGRAILTQFGLAKTDKTADQFLEKMKAYDPEGFAVIDAMVKDATANAAPVKNISFDDFVALRDTLQTIWELAKSNREMEIDGKRIDTDQLIEELSNQIDEVSTPKARPGTTAEITKLEKMQAKFLGLRASLRRVESWSRLMDLGKSGPFTRYFVNTVMEATVRFRQEKKARLAQYVEIIKPIEKELTGKKIQATELGYTFTNLAHLLGAILHTGNQSNKEKLLLGRGWATQNEQGELDTAKWDKFLARMYREGTITKAHMDVVQNIWNLMEEMKPAAQKAHKAMYGFYFNEITANEITTPFGQYRGGYVPAMADQMIVEDAAVRADQQALSEENNSFMFPSTGRGFSKTRVQNYTVPLVMDLRSIPSHIDKVQRFIHIQPTVKSLARIVFDKGFQAKLSGMDSKVRSEMLVPYLQRAASQKVEVQSQGSSGKAIADVARWIRKRAGMLTMTWNVVNGVQNLAGIFPALTMVGKGHMARSLMLAVSAPAKTAKMMSEKSLFMKDRMEKTAQEIQGEVEDMVSNPNAFEKGKAASIRYGYLFQKVTQDFMDKTAWVAGYNQAIAEGKDEKEAIRYADSVVRLTQADMSPESVSKFETGSAGWRLFNMFSGYFNTQANLQATEQGLAMELGGLKGGQRSVYVYLIGFAAPAFVAALIAQAFGGKWDEDDDGSVMDDLIEMFFGSQIRYGLAMLPTFGPVVQGAAGYFTDKTYDDKISMSPAINLIERSAGGAASVYKAAKSGDAKKFKAQDAITAIGLATGLPTGIVGRPANYLQKVSQGKAEPSGPIDYTRGLITGRPGAK